MLLSVMRVCRNFFEYISEISEFSLMDSNIILDGDYKIGQYVLLTGSILIDNVYKIVNKSGNQYTLENADIDENWSGIVYGLRIPPDFLELVDNIQVYVDNEGDPETRNLKSERYPSYTWEVLTGNDGKPLSWIDYYADRLNNFRKMFASINV